MPPRLWFLLVLLCGAIACGSGFALYVGIQEVRLHAAGPRKQLRAEELTGKTAGFVLVRGCVRHDLEVAVSPDGQVVTGERDEHDRIYAPLTGASDCDEEPARSAAGLHVWAVLCSGGEQQGLSALYGRGYRAPPTVVFAEGIIGFGAGDGRLDPVALRELSRRGVAVAGVPLLVKGRHPAPLGVAWATAAVGTHGLLLLLFVGGLALRRQPAPQVPAGAGEDADQPGSTN